MIRVPGSDMSIGTVQYYIDMDPDDYTFSLDRSSYLYEGSTNLPTMPIVSVVEVAGSRCLYPLRVATSQAVMAELVCQRQVGLHKVHVKE